MRNLLVIASGVVSLLMLSGCGTLPKERTAPSSYRQSLDSEMIAVVETTAVRNGTQVFWINPPQKPKKD